jgi:hypothetical protein
MGEACNMNRDEEQCIKNFGGGIWKRPLERPRRRWRILKCILKKRNRKEWNGFLWFRMRNNGRFLNKVMYLQVL